MIMDNKMRPSLAQSEKIGRRALIGAAAASGVLPRYGQAKPHPLRIGVLNDQTGLYADLGGPTSVMAARMAVQELGGEVLGRTVEIVAADHQNKADVALSIARSWSATQGVTAFAELTNSAVALAVQHFARDRGKITLLTGPATTRLTNEECSPTGFHWVFDTYSQAGGTAKAMLAEGGKTWFLLVADYAFGHQWHATCGRWLRAMAVRYSAKSSIRSVRQTFRRSSPRHSPRTPRSSDLPTPASTH